MTADPSAGLIICIIHGEPGKNILKINDFSGVRIPGPALRYPSAVFIIADPSVKIKGNCDFALDLPDPLGQAVFSSLDSRPGMWYDGTKPDR